MPWILDNFFNSVNKGPRVAVFNNVSNYNKNEPLLQMHSVDLIYFECIGLRIRQCEY